MHLYPANTPYQQIPIDVEAYVANMELSVNQHNAQATLEAPHVLNAWVTVQQTQPSDVKGMNARIAKNVYWVGALKTFVT